MSDPAAPVVDPIDAARARDAAAIRALLGADAPPADLHPLGVLRRPSASTFVLLQQTLNEWALGIAPEQMANKQLATLSWLYLQSIPPAEASAVAFDIAKFNAAVLAWGDRAGPDGEPLFTITMLDAATRYVESVMTAKKALAYDIQDKPPKPGDPPKETEPPN
jgi:hypothetical protein